MALVILWLKVCILRNDNAMLLSKENYILLSGGTIVPKKASIEATK